MSTFSCKRTQTHAVSDRDDTGQKAERQHGVAGTDLEADVPLWSYFCQISDSTTSYGSYSGATPNEKITWEKLSADTPRFIIESDATIVAPLLFAYVCANEELEPLRAAETYEFELVRSA